MKIFKSFFNKKTLAEDTIKANEETYWKIRKEKPNEDEHFYLATTLYRRFEARRMLGQNLFNNLAQKYGLPSKGEQEMLSMFCFSETKLFSILNPPESIRALALYIVYKENPSEAVQYSEEFNKIMEPIMRMQDDGTFEDFYRKKNPKLAKKMDKLG